MISRMGPWMIRGNWFVIISQYPPIDECVVRVLTPCRLDLQIGLYMYQDDSLETELSDKKLNASNYDVTFTILSGLWNQKFITRRYSVLFYAVENLQMLYFVSLTHFPWGPFANSVHQYLKFALLGNIAAK